MRHTVIHALARAQSSARHIGALKWICEIENGRTRNPMCLFNHLLITLPSKEYQFSEMPRGSALASTPGPGLHDVRECEWFWIASLMVQRCTLNTRIDSTKWVNGVCVFQTKETWPSSTRPSHFRYDDREGTRVCSASTELPIFRALLSPNTYLPSIKYICFQLVIRFLLVRWLRPPNAWRQTTETQR